ncbi:hypothetical protein GCM10011614_27410 [Novosphingobium colocasiae]|uniref:DUF559 domain-containing protein n=2 Tax=Novosphingobium colocasiae TaxID=1256513 RepID=A0A918PK56_9SPHN|nr:hypothetical protein GCM10011614_27410 [Novosphingobium colocasiae]
MGVKMKRHAPPISILYARQLRNNPTDAEIAMWRMLRQHFATARFRRQVPLRHYIVDFASHRLQLVIEIDGGQHNPDIDGARTRLIEAEGYRVIRFWNAEVLQNPQGCMAHLAGLLQTLSP